MYLQLCFLALAVITGATPEKENKMDIISMIRKLRILSDPDDPDEFFSEPVDVSSVFKEMFGEDVSDSTEYSTSKYIPPELRGFSTITPDSDYIFGHPEHFVWMVYLGNSGENVSNKTQVPNDRSTLPYDCYKTNQTNLNEYLPGVPHDNGVNYPEQFVWNTSILYQEPTHRPSDEPPNYLCNKRHSIRVDSTRGIPGLNPIQDGSIRRIPGLHFPNYKDIPLTSFSCSDKPYVPGYYADLETECQVFHVCLENKKESFFCPLGTIFNQAVLTCDHWYNTNCSMTPHLYELNARPQTASKERHSTVKDFETDKIISSSGKNEETLPKNTVRSYVPLPSVPPNRDEFRGYSSEHPPSESDLSHIRKLLPIKENVSVYPVSKETKVEAVASTGSYDERKQWSIYQPNTESKPKTSTYSRGIDPSISKIIDDAFDIARQVIDRAAGFIPRRESQNVKRNETSETPRTRV